MRTRDMTQSEFRDALRRHGWTQTLLWISGIDRQTGNTCGVGMVMTRKRGGWKFDRRATLAKAKRELESKDDI